MIEVRDNFLPEDIFEKLKEDIVYCDNFPWFLTRVLDLSIDIPEVTSYMGKTMCNEDDNRQFCYLFFKTDNQGKLKDSPHMGRELDKIVSLIDRYEFTHDPKYFFIQAKANLNIRTEKPIEHGFHRDHPWNGKTSVFYLNDNNGYTKFENGEVIESKANRAVIFDSPELHTGSTQTDEYARYVVNLNWVEKNSPNYISK